MLRVLIFIFNCHAEYSTDLYLGKIGDGIRLCTLPWESWNFLLFENIWDVGMTFCQYVNMEGQGLILTFSWPFFCPHCSSKVRFQWKYIRQRFTSYFASSCLIEFTLALYKHLFISSFSTAHIPFLCQRFCTGEMKAVEILEGCKWSCGAVEWWRWWYSS